MPSVRRLLLLASISLLTAACGGPETASTENPDAGASAAFRGVVAVLPVKDHAASVAWYSQWLGRAPDVVPMEGVAEWKLVNNGWVQIALDPEHAGHTSVVVTVQDVEAQRQSCVDAGLSPGELQDFGVVKLVELPDPDGNKLVFVQEVQAAPAE